MKKLLKLNLETLKTLAAQETPNVAGGTDIHPPIGRLGAYSTGSASSV